MAHREPFQIMYEKCGFKKVLLGFSGFVYFKFAKCCWEFLAGRLVILKSQIAKRLPFGNCVVVFHAFQFLFQLFRRIPFVVFRLLKNSLQPDQSDNSKNILYSTSVYDFKRSPLHLFSLILIISVFNLKIERGLSTDFPQSFSESYLSED